MTEEAAGSDGFTQANKQMKKTLKKLFPFSASFLRGFETEKPPRMDPKVVQNQSKGHSKNRPAKRPPKSDIFIAFSYRWTLKNN